MNVPKLRFPEFQDAGEWEEKMLGEICNITTGKSNREDSTLIGEYTFFDRSQDIRTSDIYLFDGEAIIIAGEGQDFIPKYFVGKFDLHQRTYAIMGFSGNNGKYLFYYMYHFRRYFLTQAVGSTVKSLRLPMFQTMPIKLPCVKEQQKIADCLSSIDELITAQAQKVEALKTHKKGLMQQLFPREGETVPRLRFPEFQDAGEWEEGNLGDEKISTFVKERVPVGMLTLDAYISTENLLPDYSGVAKASKLPPSGSFTKFKTGDILVSNIRPYLKKVWQANHSGASSNDVIVIRAGEKLSDCFISFLLRNDDFIDYIMKGAKGVKMPRGDIDLIKEYPIAYPSPDEQQKIASCLSSIDELITAQSQKVEALKMHKKGLMQQLFPATHATQTE